MLVPASSPRPSSCSGRIAIALVSVAAAALVLSGCTGGLAGPSAKPTAGSTSTATPSAPADAAPTLHPDGTAEDNLPLFRAVVAQVWDTDNRGSNRAYVDALTAAGFNRADMQMTSDISTVEYAAESIQFSVRWGTDKCLIGQVGPSTGDPVSTVMPQLAGGRCLIGTTVSIDGQ